MPDCALDHLDVSIAPLLQTLIQVDEAFANCGRIIIGSVNRQQHILNAFVRFIAHGDIAAENLGRDVVPTAGKINQRAIPQRRSRHCRLDAGASRRTRDQVFGHAHARAPIGAGTGLVAATKHCLKFAELGRLETTR